MPLTALGAYVQGCRFAPSRWLVTASKCTRRASVYSGGGVFSPCSLARRGRVLSDSGSGSRTIPDLTLLRREALTKLHPHSSEYQQLSASLADPS
jgi:hypothetical protein